MGNCCLKVSRSSTMVRADENDQWVYYSDTDLQQKQRLLSDQRMDNRSNSYLSVNEISNNNCKNREVKIMLSKKKLEELLGKMEDLHNIPVNQILDRLIDSSYRFEIDHDDYQHHRLLHQQVTWKPSLQSIPEEN